MEILPCNDISTAPRFSPPREIMTLAHCLSYAHAGKRKLTKPRPPIDTDRKQVHRNHLTSLRQDSLSLPRTYRHSRFQKTRAPKSFRLHPRAVNRLGTQPILHRLNTADAGRHLEHDLRNERSPTTQDLHQDSLYLT